VTDWVNTWESRKQIVFRNNVLCLFKGREIDGTAAGVAYATVAKLLNSYDNS